VNRGHTEVRDTFEAARYELKSLDAKNGLPLPVLIELEARKAELLAAVATRSRGQNYSAATNRTFPARGTCSCCARWRSRRDRQRSSCRRTDVSNPFFSAITSYANSLSGQAWPASSPVIAGFSAIAPDFPWPAEGLFALSQADSLQSS